VPPLEDIHRPDRVWSDSKIAGSVRPALNPVVVPAKIIGLPIVLVGTIAMLVNEL
jgi:hypothetical protein